MIGQSPECFTVYARFPYVLFCTYLGAESRGGKRRIPKNVLFVGPPGSGKAQPLHAKVLTPTGWKRMGDVHVGDEVMDPTTGSATTVTGIYPQGVKAIYRVTFSDGSSAECCAEHLWLTQTRNARRDGGSFKVRSLAEIMRTLLSSDGRPNHYIPLTAPFEFPEEKVFPLDPYLLGVLLGDGHFGVTRLLLSTADEEMVTRVRAVLPSGMVCERTRTSSPYDYNIRRQKPYSETPWPKHNPFFALLSEMGLMGTRAADKHVPPSYLFASSATRLAILQGLLDTDGSVPSRKRHAVDFSTNSRQLAHDVAFLVQSLGGTARISLRPSKIHYRVSVKLPAHVAPFRLTRKASLYRPAMKYLPRRAITAVAYIGEMEAQCLSVESPAQLYVTDNCIVTHNTFFVRALAAEVGFNAVALKSENILGGIVGESEGKLKRFFELVRALSPAIVFVDEIDQTDMSRRGQGSGNPVASNLFNQMMQFMSDETLRGKVMMFFATNRPDLLDDAIKRLGRMDAIIPVTLPGEDARRGIALAQARAQDVILDEALAALIAAESTDYSAADLAAIVGKAADLAARDDRSTLGREDVEKALSYIRPNTPQVARYYTLLAVEACNDTEFLPQEYAGLLNDRPGLQAEIKATRAAADPFALEEREGRE